jgi:hypothetical protein
VPRQGGIPIGGGGGGFVITSPLKAGAPLGKDFKYTLATEGGTTPVAYKVEGTLPVGLFFNGVDTISGKASSLGEVKTVNVTATDSSIPAKTAGPKELAITVTEWSGSNSQSLVDTDKDGFPDELETALKTNPNDVKSTPVGGSTATPQALTLTSMSITLCFVTGKEKGAINIAGTLPVTANMQLLGQAVVLDVGGVIRPYSLDTKGSIPKGTDKFKLSARAKNGLVTTAGAAKFRGKLALTATDMQWLVDEGRTSADVPGYGVNVPVIVLFTSVEYEKNPALEYKAKKGKTGRAKL